MVKFHKYGFFPCDEGQECWFALRRETSARVPVRGVFGSVDTANTLWRADRLGPTAREARLGTIPASLMLIKACATSMCAGERGVHVSPVGRKGLASLLKPLAGMDSI